MTLSEERETLRQIGILRRSRTAVENSQALQADIDAHRTRVVALQKRLGSGSVATAARIDIVREELETMRKESDAAFSERGELYVEREQLQTQLYALHDLRRQAVERFKTEREEHRRMADEQRAQNAARARAERAAKEEQQRVQAQERLLEKARTPAFAAEIRDCRSLLEYFSSAVKGESASSSSSSSVPSIAEATHQLRQPVDNYPEAYPLAGSVPLKKKGEEEDVYFVGGKGKRKKGNRKGQTSSTTGSAKVSVPIGILSTLVSLSIDPPTVTADLPRTIEELRKKIEWYEGTLLS